jgi:predicted phage terminase large subunit-like protein
MPIAYLYGDDVYIVDVVFDNSAPDVTKPECAKMLMKHKVVSATFESNSAGEYFARDVYDICLKNGYSFNLRKKRTISNKMTRIEMASDGIKKHFYFKHPSIVKRGSQYYEFMKEVTTLTRTGKVPHDDAPDSLSLLENEIRNRARGKIEIIERFF